MEIFGYRFFLYGLSLIPMAPLLIWLWHRGWRYTRAKRRGELEQQPLLKKQLKTAALVTLALFVLLHWDVFVIAHQANKLCREQGGLKIYRTVEAEGFAGDDTIEYWSKYGYRYAEGGFREKIWRSEMIDGQPVRRRVDNYISRYGIVISGEVVNKRLERRDIKMSGLETDELLGEFSYFLVYPGWFEAYLVGKSGFSFSPWQYCRVVETKEGRRKALDFDDLVLGTLTPPQKSGERDEQP